MFAFDLLPEAPDPHGFDGQDHHHADISTIPERELARSGTRMSGVETDEVLALIDHALSAHPSDATKHRLRELAADAAHAPSLAFEELRLVATLEAARLDTFAPTTTLYRAVALETFQLYCVAAEWRAPAVHPEVFRRYVERHTDPDAFLLSTIAHGIVFPADHSWLIDATGIERLSGTDLVHALQLDKQTPPMVLCRLTADRMRDAGVRIRRPTGFDAVLGRHTIWSPNGLRAGVEYVDLDIPGSAVEVALWRP